MTGMAHIPVARDCSGQGEPPYATVLEDNAREITPWRRERQSYRTVSPWGYLLGQDNLNISV